MIDRSQDPDLFAEKLFINEVARLEQVRNRHPDTNFDLETARLAQAILSSDTIQNLLMLGELFTGGADVDESVFGCELGRKVYGCELGVFPKESDRISFLLKAENCLAENSQSAFLNFSPPARSGITDPEALFALEVYEVARQLVSEYYEGASSTDAKRPKSLTAPEYAAFLTNSLAQLEDVALNPYLFHTFTMMGITKMFRVVLEQATGLGDRVHRLISDDFPAVRGRT